MHLLDRIDHALTTKTVDADAFERFALDVLGPIFPGLAPIPKGTDWGRDADVPGDGDAPAVRVMVTRGQTLEGVRANMVRGINSLAQHGQPADRVVLANLAVLSARDRSSLEQTANKHGIAIAGVYDRVYFANQLRREGEWRTRLLGIPGDPISVSRLPVELAESPLARLPLVGRESELVALRSTTGDMVVVGPPGSGKTRLLAELDGAVFVARDAEIGTLADDLRMLQPAVVVVDDAGDRRVVLRQLRELRSQEPDLLSFQLVAVCWPDEADDVSGEIPSASVVELDLLERSPMDQLVQSTGITSTVARHELLAQAEGRPGWAVALAEVLLTTREPGRLLSGRALLGHVGHYLRRRRFHDATSDLLATIAALGGVEETQLLALAETLAAPRAEVVARLRSAARSGLVDVAITHTSTGPVKAYQVRPPMLANALAAERLFDVDVPLVDVRALFAEWPEHRGAIACAAIDAVRLGVASARGIAQALFDSVLMDEAVAAVGRVKAAHAFGSLERQSAQHVLTVLRPGFDALIAAGGDKVAWDLEPYVALAADIARWKLPEAVEMLLDAAVIDQRATNPYPGHPLRKIEDLVTSFHPEMPSDPSVPAFLAEAAGSWLDAHVGEPAAWDVYGDTAAAALDLGRSGAFTDPGNPLTVTLHQTVADPAQVTAVAENVWPGILRRLDDAPTRAIVKVLEAIERWLWIGADHDRPFGASHAPDRIDAARTGGRRLLADLRSLVAGHPGLAARYNNLAEQHGIDHGVQISEDIAPFFRNAELSLDWQAEQASIRAGIADVVEEWAAQPPDTICRRLVELRDQIEIAGLQWPPRIRVACDMLAENAPECLPWIEAALKEGLFPDADGMLREHRQRGGRFDVDMIGAAMTEPAARAAFAGAVLADLDAAPDELATVLGRLDGRDLNLFVSLGYTELPPERHRLLLTEPPPAARAAAAAAYAHRLSFDAGWSPGELAEPWLDALSGLPSLTNVASHDAQAILDYVATHDPECFVELLTPYLAELDRGERSAPMLPQFLSATRLLEPTHKTKLLAGIGRGARWLVLQHMIGPDPGWLAEAIDTGAISLDEALTACGGLGTRPSVQDLARVLVPLGADPERVAAVEMSGFWSGPRSDHFAQIAERFTAMSDSSDPSIAAVGSAGAQLFTRLADEARADEHRDRIRGYE